MLGNNVHNPWPHVYVQFASGSTSYVEPGGAGTVLVQHPLLDMVKTADGFGQNPFYLSMATPARRISSQTVSACHCARNLRDRCQVLGASVFYGVYDFLLGDLITIAGIPGARTGFIPYGDFDVRLVEK